MTHPEHQYLDLMRDLLKDGVEQVDAGTGVKTYSLFGRQMRFDLSQGFPLLTTKRSSGEACYTNFIGSCPGTTTLSSWSTTTSTFGTIIHTASTAKKWNPASRRK
jgi:thymidylate synthase